MISFYVPGTVEMTTPDRRNDRMSLVGAEKILELEESWEET